MKRSEQRVCAAGALRGLGVGIATALLIGGLAGGPPAVAGAPQTAAGAQPAAADGLDTIIFKDGRVVKGKIIAQSETTVTVKGEVNGIPFQTQYERTNILDIKLAPKAEGDTKGGVTPAKPDAKPAVRPAPAKAPADAGDPNAKKVYVMELTGRFARDTSQTPIREALADAKKNGADVVVVTMENDWIRASEEDAQDDNKDDYSAFDELFRVEDMDQIFVEELPRWEKPPRLVFWVKRAMGGPAFLTLASPEIYFSSEARMGGVGWVNQMLEGFGDEVVQKKMVAARIGHAEGIAARSGYPTQIVRAMAITEYVLSVSFEGGRPQFHERMPDNDSEILLTDTGAGDQKDTEAKIVAGEGNDVLTLNAKIAKDLGISRGTVDTLDDLLFELGLSKTGVVVKGRAGQIMKSWSDGVDKAERDVRRLVEDLNTPQPSGTFDERTRARGRAKKILGDIKRILDRYGEAFGREQINQINAIITDWQNQITHQQQEDALAQRKRK